MSHPDNFNEQNDKEKQNNEQAGREPIDPERAGLAFPQWYGISYRTEEELSHESGRRMKRKSKSQRVLFVLCATFLAITLLLLGALGGVLLTRQWTNEGDGYFNPTTSDRNTDPSGTVYSSEGSQQYDYAAAVIPKNDGAALADSTNGSAGENAKGMIDMIENVKDSVVEIMTTVNSYRGTISAGAGSGVIIHADGIIVTNHHVVENCDTIYVRLTNGNTYQTYLRGSDEDGDIALLKIVPQETLSVAKLGYSGALRVGEDVVAIGNPLGELGGTVTDGIISALEREVLIDGVTMTLLQTNAAINSGNSGGGLFNMAGELIGVVNAKYSATGVEGLGFAIPIDTAYESIDKLLKHGYIPGIPTLGVAVQEKPGFTANYQTITILYVADVGTSTVFQKGDYVLEIGGVSVTDADHLTRLVRQYEVGQTVEVVVQRNRERVTLQITLQEYIPSR